MAENKSAAILLVFLWASVLLFPAGPSFAQETKTTVIWAVADRPTSFIFEGPDKGRGVVDEVYNKLHTALPDYEHVLLEMNFPRTLNYMREGERVCSTGFWTADREKVALFSLPVILALPYGVICLKERVKEFDSGAGRISLTRLLADKRLRGAVLQARSYGEITPMVKASSDDSTLRVLPPGANTIQMLTHGYLDYIIEIPSFVMYQAKQQGEENRLESLSIEEYVTPVLVAHIFCTRGQWGEGFIRQLNEIIERERGTEEYREFIERW
ncbi:MAG: TIGR02285 family protein, partial [Proteobacteria bacterium]|nr:TIGR02285 family protein [Pseudomonadota bacterium]